LTEVDSYRLFVVKYEYDLLEIRKDGVIKMSPEFLSGCEYSAASDWNCFAGTQNHTLNVRSRKNVVLRERWWIPRIQFENPVVQTGVR
jgi:hypothetical protein